MEAHQIFGEAEHLRRAEYWAKTGLPFLYLWNLPDRPGMRYGSIPIFGATFYTHSWFGVPVQWNGLVYAYYIQRLSMHSEFPWKTIAEGIAASALQQQWTEGELKGTYPDALYESCQEGRGPHINPENIMANLFALRGYDPDISTGVLKAAGARVHISSGAMVGNLEAEREAFRFTLTGFTGHDSFAYIGNAPPIESIALNASRLNRLDQLDQHGWMYSSERDAAALRIPQRNESERIEARLVPGARAGRSNGKGRSGREESGDE